MAKQHRLSVIDSHTAGEPTRIITDGFPEVVGETMKERMEFLRNEMDWVRQSMMREPRGHRDMFGGILLPPLDPSADAAVIYMDGGRYYNMCGHASIGIAAMMVETGRVPSKQGSNIVRLETPAGIVEGSVEVDQQGEVTSVSLIDVPSFAWSINQPISIPGYGSVTVDIGFGGNFFVIVEAGALGVKSIGPENTSELINTGIAIRQAANEQISVRHPLLPHIDTIDICMITAPPSGDHSDARNIVILGDAQADRSPCGTGTCARMAVMYEKGLLGIGELFRHESSIQSVFNGRILHETDVGNISAIVPEISCRPFITGYHNFVIHPEDPFAKGFVL